MVSKVKKRREILSANSKVTDEEILQFIFDGHTDHFEYLMRRYNQRFYRIARAHNIQDPYCDKLIRDTFLRIYANLKYFNGKTSFISWAMMIHLQQCKQYIQNWKRLNLSSNKLYSIRPHSINSTMVRKEINNIYEHGISKLPFTMRLVYVLREMNQRNSKDVATFLNISELKVKICYFRAKLFLKKYMDRNIRNSEVFIFSKDRCDELVRQVFIEIRQIKIAFANIN